MFPSPRHGQGWTLAGRAFSPALKLPGCLFSLQPRPLGPGACWSSKLSWVKLGQPGAGDLPGESRGGGRGRGILLPCPGISPILLGRSGWAVLDVPCHPSPGLEVAQPLLLLAGRGPCPLQRRPQDVLRLRLHAGHHHQQVSATPTGQCHTSAGFEPPQVGGDPTRAGASQAVSARSITPSGCPPGSSRPM